MSSQSVREAVPQAADPRPGPFISYAREDRTFVRQLHDALLERDRDPWVDWELRPAAEWMQEIRAAIDAAPAVVFVLSPDSIASQVCREELEHAWSQSKRIVPVMCRDVDAETVPDSLRKLNWIHAVDPSRFLQVLETVIEALDTDLAWVHAHARLLVRAQDWETRGRDRSLLLGGTDLKESEGWLVRISEQQTPHMTDLQRRFVVASREGETARQRQALVAIVGALIVTAALAVYAFVQSRIAIAERDTALSRMLAAKSLGQSSDPLGHLDIALLQSVAAMRMSPTAEAQESLTKALAATNRIEKFVHTAGTLVGLDVSPDGRTIATGDFDGGITLWGAETMRPKSNLKQGESVIRSVAFSPDGKTLAAADANGVVLWDTATGARVRTFESQGGRTTTVAWSADGNTLVMNDGGIVFRNMRSGTELAQMIAEHDSRALVISPDGKTVATAGDSLGIQLWDSNSREGRVILNDRSATVRALAFNPDGTLLASGGADAAVVLWDMVYGREHSRLEVHTDSVDALAFSPDGSTLASGAHNHRVFVWNLASDELEELRGHTNGLLNLAFTPDGKKLVSNAFESGFIVWNLGPPLDRNALTRHSGEVAVVAVSADGAIIASGSSDRTIRLWDVANERERAELIGHGSAIRAIAMNHGRRMLASSDEDHDIWLWNTDSGRVVGKIETSSSVRSLAFSPDGALLASAADLSGVISLWDVNTGGLQSELVPAERGETVSTVAFSGDGRILVSGGSDAIHVWDPARHAEVGKPIRGASFHSVAVSPDGSLIAASQSFVDKVLVWELDATEGPLAVDTNDVQGIGQAEIAFSPDGRTLAHTSGEYRMDIALWDVAHRTEAGALRSDSTTTSIAFIPDGKRIVTGHSNGAVILWDADTANWPERACAIANRNFTLEEWRVLVGDDLPYVEVCPKAPVPGH